MHEALALLVETVGLFCEVATVLMIAVGAVEVVVRLAVGWRHSTGEGLKRTAWVRFASWILLALEFALAADIVRTAIAPTWDDIGQLAAIAAIRTLLNFFLERDVEAFIHEREEKQKGEVAP